MNDFVGAMWARHSGGHLEGEILRVEHSKLHDYLLNEMHPQGKAKAHYFKSRGFTRGNVSALEDSLRHHASSNKIIEVVENSYGKKYIVECHHPVLEGDSRCIRVTWIDHGEGQPPRLVTAHPFDL